MSNVLRLESDPESVRAAAISHGVCVRPVLHQVHDTTTGQTRIVPIPCGATRESQCPPCADKARRLRMQQCREGWHLDDEPETETSMPTDDDTDPHHAAGNAGAEPDEAEGDGASRRVRSTRRRQDVPDLPRLPVAKRTIGKTLASPSGNTYRPSMFLTLTLPSYGPVHGDGTPVDPESYDYRRAALDAMHFGKLVDRWWQNLRRCAGYQVQYFATVEPQKRLAAHLHAAVRGVVPRSVVEQVAAATYHQVWWPPHEHPVYAGRMLPVWDDHANGYVDPHAGHPLPTWDEALDELDAQLDAEPATRPAHTVRFGHQVDYQWFIRDSRRTDRRIGYLTKYLTKSIAGEADEATPRQRKHAERLHEHLRWLPCTPECANWLRFGIQPKACEAGMTPGECDKRAHDPDRLGYSGRRVLVSRKWTGKTLEQHKQDRADVVRQALACAGIEPDDDAGGYSATATDHHGRPRYLWTRLNAADVDHPRYIDTILRAIARHRRWRTQYEHAKQHTGLDPGTYSATASAATAGMTARKGVI